MREMLQFMARYNRDANNGMMAVLKNMPEEDLRKNLGIYYGSVLGTFEHILAGDIAIFGGVYRNYCKDPDAVNNDIFQCASFEAGVKPEAKKDLAALFETRRKTDEAMIKIVDNLENLSKIEELELPGITFKKPRYQMVMSMLTHSTHHRGQIAAALDILGVDNDFGGMLPTE